MKPVVELLSLYVPNLLIVLTAFGFVRSIEQWLGSLALPDWLLEGVITVIALVTGFVTLATLVGRSVRDRVSLYRWDTVGLLWSFWVCALLGCGTAISVYEVYHHWSQSENFRLVVALVGGGVTVGVFHLVLFSADQRRRHLHSPAVTSEVGASQSGAARA